MWGLAAELSSLKAWAVDLSSDLFVLGWWDLLFIFRICFSCEGSRFSILPLRVPVSWHGWASLFFASLISFASLCSLGNVLAYSLY